MKKNVYIAVAAMIMMGAATTANAADGTFTTTGGNEVVSFEAATAKKTAYAVAAVPQFTVGTAGFMTNTGISTYTLTTSAGTFLTGTTSTASATTLNATTAATIPTGGVGTATVTWSANAPGVAGDTLDFASKLDVSGVAAGTAIDYTLTAKGAGGAVIGTATVSGGTAANQIANVTSTWSHTETDISDTADVATGFLKFTTSGTAVMNASDLKVLQAASAVPNASGTALVTLSGDFTGIQSVTVNNAAVGSTAAGVTTAVTNTTKGVAGQMFIDHAAGKAYAVVTVGTNSNIAVNPTFTGDGAAALVAGSFTADVALLADANVAAGAVGTAAAPVLTITRNGTSIRMNLVLASDALVLTNNASTATGNLTYSAVDAAGGPITEVAIVAPGVALQTVVAPGKTVTISGASLNAAFPGAAQITVNAESNDINAQMIHIVTGVGASTNVSGTNAL